METRCLGVGRGVKIRENEGRHRACLFSGGSQLVSPEALCTSQIETTSASWGEELKAACIGPGSCPTSNSLISSVFSFFFPSWFSFLHFPSASSTPSCSFPNPRGGAQVSLSLTELFHRPHPVTKLPTPAAQWDAPQPVINFSSAASPAVCRLILPAGVDVGVSGNDGTGAKCLSPNGPERPGGMWGRRPEETVQGGGHGK